ncbi:hypothetical protein [Spartinivicinus ruber]|uniref:hypothetical protein n=1 Tax=Spartinivicinus ruber TaxID=2683272 RepID=UPI0013D1314A|nr:hypothetical protein [Spartinivicinus ruber]
MIKKGLATLALGSVLAASAHATVYTYEQGMRNVQSAKFTYDDQTQKFSLNATLKGNTDGLWAVVNRGNSPSTKNAGFMHIDLKNNVITVNKGYSILGQNYKNPVVQRFENVINYHKQNNQTTLDFTIDVAQINAQLRQNDPLGGIEFNNTIGGWVHVDYSPRASYNGNQLTYWKYSGVNGLDFHNKQSTVIVPPKPPVPVPTPAPLALIALGLLGLYRRAKA